MGPLDLQVPAGLCAVGLLGGTVWSLWGPAPKAAPGRGTWITLALSLALGGGALLAKAPLAAGALGAAEAVSTPRLPADDVGGHRRLWRLQQRRQWGGPRDAGP
ncbi:MAG: hypothetical protein H6702_21930 [Myxococcales bacterium]|nr:hypothetical protein [Myxococcales bacterium]